MALGLFSSKRVDDILKGAEPKDSSLKRALSAFDLTLLGVGAIVGAGIFTALGTAAAGNAARPGAGPSLILSFIITAIVCTFCGLCYAELAALVPISGSAYTYAYATLGELVAWMIGWDLILEYAISNVAIAISWSNYCRVLLHGLGIDVPMWLCIDYRTAHASMPDVIAHAPHFFGFPIVFNFLAVFIVAALTALVVWGIKESARVNTVIVLIKLLVLAFFVGVAAYLTHGSQASNNLQPFFPNGFSGTLAGASIVFFAYVGFDSVSTVAEETRDPGRNVPLGIMLSLVVCTVFYLAVTLAFCSILSFDVLKAQMAKEQAEPLTLALRQIAPHVGWLNTVIALGALIAETAAILVYQIAQPRIFFVMARDGLLPRMFTLVHPRFGTPWVTTLVTGVVVAAIAGFASLDEMIDLTNIGTLFAFILVCIGVPILRFVEPDRPRPFKIPLGPFVVPGLGATCCLALMIYLPPASWWRFVGWFALGLSVYAAHGYSKSILGRALGREQEVTNNQRCVAFGFLLVAIGLFWVPHESSPQALWQLAHSVGGFGATQPGATRAQVGLGLLGMGILVTVAPSLRARLRRV